MRVAAAIALASARAACNSAREPARDAPADAGPAASPSPAAIASRAPAELAPASALLGEWRVAGVDGRSIDLPYGIAASIDERTIHVVADCVNLGWTYAAESGAFEARRAPVESCARGLTPEEAAIAEAIDTATGFGRTPSNAMEIFSADHRVTLYSQ
jgi:hypothetical protein